MRPRRQPLTYAAAECSNASCDDTEPTWDVLGHLYRPDGEGGWDIARTWCAESFKRRIDAVTHAAQLNRWERARKGAEA